jgi:hypothetical protein
VLVARHSVGYDGRHQRLKPFAHHKDLERAYALNPYSQTVVDAALQVQPQVTSIDEISEKDCC